jgi:hypothetical protein
MHPLLPLLLLLPPTLSHPLPPLSTFITILQQIAPTSTSCLSATYPLECATATHAAPFLLQSFHTYNLTSPRELSALLSLIAYETGDFKYNTNHFPAPGRPGQGTRNMQMASYNLAYARDMPELGPALQGLGVSAGAQAEDLSPELQDAVRGLVLEDRYAWASAAWFLDTWCSEDVRGGLRDQGRSGWEAYLVGCVGTQVDDGRVQYWERANEALGLSSD